MIKLLYTPSYFCEHNAWHIRDLETSTTDALLPIDDSK